MKKIKLFSVLIILFSLIVFSSLNLYAFPKKSSSLIKDKNLNITKADELKERLSITGYYLGVANFCSYQMAKQKDLYKSLKGVAAYTNWKLFLMVNKGWQLVESDLWIAGHGWAGGNGSTWQQKPIDWRYNVTGCEPKTYDLIYNYFDEFIFKVIIYYLYNLSEENFDQNIETLLNLLKNDRKDDYSIAINQIATIVTDINFENNIKKNNIQESTIENYNVSDQKNENSIDENSIDEKLTKLKQLFDKELISEEEYKKKKEEILSEF